MDKYPKVIVLLAVEICKGNKDLSAFKKHKAIYSQVSELVSNDKLMAEVFKQRINEQLEVIDDVPQKIKEIIENE